MARYTSFKYEVSGKVQGVFFRQHTKEKANALGVVGWVQNTPRDTVTGEVQGEAEAAEQMKVYLQKEGSPPSRIDKCDISDERHDLTELSYSDFSVC